MGNATCVIDGCDRSTHARNWCAAHYANWRQRGNPQLGPPNAEQRFWAKVDKTETCWLWTGYTQYKGYGEFRPNKGEQKLRAHRYAYQQLVGPIPDGLQLDHLCRVRHCVNPAHLEPVTPRENQLRSPLTFASIHGGKTHCVNGHEFTADNTRARIAPNGRASRCCRACDRRWAANYIAKKRQARLLQRAA